MIPFKYAIIIFSPYPHDIGEFVNCGAIAWNVTEGLKYWFFDEAEERVRAFFPEISPEVYQEGKTKWELELAEKTKIRLAIHDIIYHDLTYASDGLFQFIHKANRMVQSEETLKQFIYDRYILRK